MAFAVGWLAGRVGLPPLVGYLGAGLLLSSQRYDPGPLVGQLSDVGVALLLFVVGLKVRWQSLVGREVVGVGILHFLLLGALGTLLMAGLGLTGKPGMILGLCLGLSSTVVTIKLLESRSELGAYHGRVAVGILILQDLLAIGLLVWLGSKAISPAALLLLAIPLSRPLVAQILERCGHSELMLLFGIAAAIGGASLATYLGISPELGALLAGIALAGHERSNELAKTIWGVRELLLVAFFLQIGMMGLPPSSDFGAVALILLAVPAKAYLFFVLFTRFRLRSRTAFVASTGLASFSEFALIVGNAAAGNGVLPEKWVPILGLATLISMAVVAPVNRNVHTLYERLGSWLRRFERGALHEEHEPTHLGAADWVIIGMGRTGGGAYKALEAQGHRPIGLDADPAKISRSIAKGRRVVYGDAEDPELWTGLDVGGIHGVLLTLPDLEAKVRAIRYLRARGFTGIIAATTLYNEEDPIMLRHGVDILVHPFAGAGERLAQEAMQAVKA
ncbi:MAG: putative cation/proton antiporter YbaL [Fimbriimonadaceae bacterium]|nr:putative cation/proton antiporter YbaL [Fimbriimonadaceae bacterium]